MVDFPIFGERLALRGRSHRAMTSCAPGNWKDFRRRYPVKFLLAPPGIVQSLPENRFHVEIRNDQFFLKLFAASEKIAVLVEDETVAVEHQLILGADQIVIRHDSRVVGCAGAEHTFAPMTLSGMIRRRRNIDDDFGATRKRLKKYGSIRVPNILTNTHTYSRAVHPQDWAGFAGLEVSKLVENAVVRQIHFVIRRDELSILSDGSGIEDVVLPIDKPNDGCDIPCPADDPVQSGEIGIDELRLQQ